MQIGNAWFAISNTNLSRNSSLSGELTHIKTANVQKYWFGCTSNTAYVVCVLFEPLSTWRSCLYGCDDTLNIVSFILAGAGSSNNVKLSVMSMDSWDTCDFGQPLNTTAELHFYTRGSVYSLVVPSSLWKQLHNVF